SHQASRSSLRVRRVPRRRPSPSGSPSEPAASILLQLRGAGILSWSHALHSPDALGHPGKPPAPTSGAHRVAGHASNELRGHRVPAPAPDEVRRPAHLYGVPPEKFTAARHALVAALRRAGDERGATEAAAIKRPTLPLWAINQLARRDQALIARLIEAAERLQMAHPGRRPRAD